MYITHFKPYEKRIHNRQELFNEVINMLVCYNFFVFTDWVPLIETQYLWGFSSIAYVTLMISVNMLLIIALFT